MQHERYGPPRGRSGLAHPLRRFSDDRLCQRRGPRSARCAGARRVGRHRAGASACPFPLPHSPEMSLDPLRAIAANLSRARWRPSPRKTAASFCTCTTLDAVSASIHPRSPACSRKFISTSAASSIASLPASAWSSMKAASARKSLIDSRPQRHSRPHQPPEKSRRPRRLRQSASPTRSPCASTSPALPPNPLTQQTTATSISHSERSKDHFLSARLLRGESTFFFRRPTMLALCLPRPFSLSLAASKPCQAILRVAPWVLRSRNNPCWHAILGIRFSPPLYTCAFFRGASGQGHESPANRPRS